MMYAYWFANLYACGAREHFFSNSPLRSLRRVDHVSNKLESTCTLQEDSLLIIYQFHLFHSCISWYYYFNKFYLFLWTDVNPHHGPIFTPGCIGRRKNHPNLYRLNLHITLLRNSNGRTFFGHDYCLNVTFIDIVFFSSKYWNIYLNGGNHMIII